MEGNSRRQPAFSVEDVERFVELVDARLIRQTGGVIYVATTLNGVSASDKLALWMVDDAGSKPELLSDGELGECKPDVSPDGSEVALLRGEERERQVAVRSLRDGELRVLTSFSRGVGGVGPQWSPDGSMLAFDGCDEPVRDKDRPYRVTRIDWRWDSFGLIDDARTDIFIVPRVGGDPRRLTFDEGVISFLSWSPNGRELLYGVWAKPNSTEYEINVVDYASGTVRTVTRGPHLVYTAVAAWGGDGKVVYSSPWSINKEIHLRVKALGSGREEVRSVGGGGQLFGIIQAGFRNDLFAPRLVVDVQGNAAYACVQQRGALVTHRFDLSHTEESVAISSPDYSSTPIDVVNGRVLAARTTFAEPPDLAVIDVKTGRQTRLTTLNEHWLDHSPFTVHGIAFAPSEKREGEDISEVEGWFLEPKERRGPHPTILHMHGGPFAANGSMFSLDNLLLTAAGYAVLSINFRGGSGYGDSFASSIIGDWGRLDLADVMEGLQTAVERGLADESRLAAFGLSGGGYMTAWVLTHSDQFKAGIAECLVSNWEGMLASDINRTVAVWMGANPGEGEERMSPYTRMAPSTYAAKCSGPLLIIEHEEDLRCPVSQGEILYNELQIAGKTVEMLRLPRVAHSPWKASVLVRQERVRSVLEWFEKFVR